MWVWAVLCLLGCAIVAATLWRRRTLGWPKLVTLGVLQGALAVLVVTLLWRPVLNVERVRDQENALAVALDASASMAHGENEQSRLQSAVAALQGGPLDAMGKVFDLRLFAFASQTTSIPTIEAVPPPGAQSRIGDAVTRVLQTGGSVPLAGVVLISDGSENGGTLTEERLAEIASYGVPIHTVGVGPTEVVNDLEIESVRAAQKAPAGATVTAEVTIRHSGEANTRLKVYDGDTLLASRDLVLPANANVTTHQVELRAGEPGTRDLRFTIDPLPNERNIINNTRAQVLDVPAERRHILYIEGEPRWEYKFIRRASDAERSLRLASLVRMTPNKNYRQGVQSGAELSEGFPTERAELFAYDAIIIGSYEAAALTAQQHEQLESFIDERGGSVLMLAGRYGLSAGGWNDAAIAETLPVHLPEKVSTSFSQRPTRVQPTPYGLESAITRLGADPKRNAQLWRELPALADYQSLGTLKPGAIVLLETNTERGRTPLLVWQRFGRGATYVLGTASTMRWQMQTRSDDMRHEMFWRQLLHAVADHAPSRTTLTTSQSVYNDERRVELSAELFDAEFKPINDAQVELLIAPETGESFTQIMQASGKNDGRYVASIDAPATGLYRADLNARVGGEGVGSAVVHFRRADGVSEHFNTRQNRPVLERLATMTGGRYWTLDNLAGLAEAIPYSKAGVVERQTLDLWNLPIVFLLLLALKLGEWLLRLRWGTL